MQLLAMALAFGLTLIISALLLRYAPKIQVAIKPELEEVQGKKRGTPSVGGFAFILGTSLTTLAFPNRFDRGVIFPLLSLVLFGLVGLVDDLAKIRKNESDGISWVAKLLLQAVAASILLLFLASDKAFSLRSPLGVLSYLLALLYILYFVNAVNITDGLDALAAGSALPLLMLLAFLSMRRGGAYSPALIGSILAFLLFNKKPARYFMGDCGSHALGGYIAVSALLLNAELLLLVASGLFLVEFFSSLIQIIAIRSTGKGVFSIAPLHHALERKGVKEQRIVYSFTLVSWLCSLVGSLLFLGTRW